LLKQSIRDLAGATYEKGAKVGRRRIERLIVVIAKGLGDFFGTHCRIFFRGAVASTMIGQSNVVVQGGAMLRDVVAHSGGGFDGVQRSESKSLPVLKYPIETIHVEDRHFYDTT
jgi:hypothetical protein